MRTDKPHVLVLSPGAKVGLVRALAESVAARGGCLTGWEADRFSPAATWCHQTVPGGPVENEGAVANLLGWCAGNGVGLVVPTRHDDLPMLAQARELFSDRGVELAVSSPECIRLCLDKLACHAWLTTRGCPVPAQGTVAELAIGRFGAPFPLFAKPPDGSGSRSVRLCRDASDLVGLPGDWIVQTPAPGREHTVNVYVDRRGRSVCEIPHERILVGEGEVVRGRTVREPVLMTLARDIAEGLPGARGPLNVQIFWDAASRRATAIEINPRFGGGYPLAHRAGGRFTDWLLSEHLDDAPLSRADHWEDALLMVRYREAQFFPRASEANDR